VDGGKSWKRFAGNPVIKNKGDGDRDPKVVWHEASQHYVMVLYVGGPDTYRLLRSKDLVTWEQTAVLPNWFECPEFFPVKSPATGEDLWLLYGCYRNKNPEKGEVFESNSCFQLGRFDGKEFKPVSKIRDAHQGPNFYGALVFVNAPGDRRVMMGWARDSRFPGEPFNQCASVPLEVKLRAIAGEDALTYEPVKELEALRGQPLLTLRDVTMADASAKLAELGLKKDALLDVIVRFKAKAGVPVRVAVRANEFLLDDAGKLSLTRNGRAAGSTVLRDQGATTARFLVDRGMVESFWNYGEAAHAIASLHTDNGPALALTGDAIVEELIVYPMSGIWK
jgi:sucrose-6-phosphate hydrolase SacC (GH32 family)